MKNYIIHLTLHIRQRDDGTFIATCKDLPVMVTARDLQGLKRKLSGIERSVDKFLVGMSEADQLAYLKEHGVEPEPVGNMAEGFSMPVLVGA